MFETGDNAKVNPYDTKTAVFQIIRFCKPDSFSYYKSCNSEAYFILLWLLVTIKFRYCYLKICGPCPQVYDLPQLLLFIVMTLIDYVLNKDFEFEFEKFFSYFQWVNAWFWVIYQAPNESRSRMLQHLLFAYKWIPNCACFFVSHKAETCKSC